MFGVGMTELLIIMLVIALIFGAKRLPEIGSGIGKGIRSFRKGVSGKEAEEESPQIEEKTAKTEKGGAEKT
jgi:sec-independent protein translocase protein TatA